MKLVIVSDIHGEIKLVKEAVKLANKNKCPLICAGDVLNWDKKHQDKFFTKILNIFNKTKKNAYIIPGSHEDLHIFYNEYFKNNKIKLFEHVFKQQVGAFDLGSHVLVMYGGSDSVVDVLTKKTYLRANPKRDKVLLGSLLDQTKPVILTTHIPPYSYCDTAYYRIMGKTKTVTRIAPAKPGDADALSEHVGSRELKKLVEHYTPQLTVYGHIHESAGSEELFTHKKVVKSKHLLVNTSKNVQLLELSREYAGIVK